MDSADCCPDAAVGRVESAPGCSSKFESKTRAARVGQGDVPEPAQPTGIGSSLLSVDGTAGGRARGHPDPGAAGLRGTRLGHRRGALRRRRGRATHRRRPRSLRRCRVVARPHRGQPAARRRCLRRLPGRLPTGRGRADRHGARHLSHGARRRAAGYGLVGPRRTSGRGDPGVPGARVRCSASPTWRRVCMAGQPAAAVDAARRVQDLGRRIDAPDLVARGHQRRRPRPDQVRPRCRRAGAPRRGDGRCPGRPARTVHRRAPSTATPSRPVTRSATYAG